MRILLLALLLALPAHADDRFTKLGTVLEFALPIAAAVCAFRQDRAGAVVGYFAKGVTFSTAPGEGGLIYRINF